MSKDIIAVATLFGSVFVLKLLSTGAVEQIYGFFDYCASLAVSLPIGGTQLYMGEIGMHMLSLFAKIAGPIIAVTVVIAVAATFAQTKFLVAGESLKPKFSRISPLKGFKRLFSLRSVIEAFKGILKIVVLIYIIYSCLTAAVGFFVNYLYTDLSVACQHLFGLIVSMVLKIGLAFTALAGFDFLYQWWDYERQLKMSKQEVKEEYKQTEGDPQIKGKIKEAQRKMSQARMMQQVPGADVVVRNPTHFAVALRYKPEADNAPIVLAKGMDELALRIVKVAEENSVPVIENVPLARSLYASVDLNREIPMELYGAVAEVLVYLYKLDRDQNKPGPPQ